MAIFDGAFHAQAVEDEVELDGGDEAVLVLIVELERVAELGGSAIFGDGAANSVREMKPSWSESSSSMTRQSSSSSKKEESRELKTASSFQCEAS